MYDNKPLPILLFALALTLISAVCPAQAQPSPMKALIHAYSIAPGVLNTSEAGATLLTITLDINPEWYAYSNIPGDSGKPTHLSAITADGTPLRVIYPKGTPKKDSYDPSVTIAAYLDGTQLFVVVPDTQPTPFPILLNLDMLLCHPTKCVPTRLDLAFENPETTPSGLPPADAQPWWTTFSELARQQNDTPLPSAAEGSVAESPVIDWQFSPTYLQPGLEVSSLLSAILMGLLAGLILNIMPCVLPVVSLKLSALLGANTTEDGKNPVAAFREHNVFFILGVLSFFLFLAIVLGATGQAWGALFQYQWLVLAIAAIMGALGLSLFGLFHLPVIDLKFGAGHANPRKQAFFTGMLTTLLATPCSGPFLGGVLGWALIQGPLVIATVFISIGIGMSSPYILMIINPKLARFLPKSGPWIEYVEKGIAFFLLGTAFYLIAIALGSESLRILAPLWTLLFGGWLWIRTKAARSNTKWSIRLATIALLVASIVWTLPPAVENNPWADFHPVATQQKMGKEILFLDFTADWCPTCKVLEATVLTDKNISRWKQAYSITFIKVDMTDRNPEAEALLKALGSRSIPTAAIFTKESPSTPIVLRDLFTVDQLENIMKSL
ncbi:cytochrome C biogenesis protein [Pseudodesulfovibrio sp. JC047]|uniref:protein-disulfide reductase DsbD family protein n=1 Tax=Pseudodesulfovibrio sp. JC047 TaxID=2683199 RepID=UPI0013CF4FDF|nr:cytochrome c biogenesis protein CcdA [Pseudodesulfovibrio sp. JC047]NDV20615.1 cytochrome C biogenesis protein [Pseudodesulfovibrio sp. JC047]